jgi:alkylhydroperoxidase/carboxymuconolactone decarboxylase family protein YurZ
MSDEAEADAEERAELEDIRRLLAERSGAVSVAAMMNEGILDKSGLDLRTFHLVRAAAMAAVGASKAGWDVNLELMDGEVTAEELEGTLVAIAPIIGSAAFLQAVSTLLED